MNQVITKIERELGVYFPNSKFKLEKKGIDQLIVSGDYLSKAMNRIKNDNNQINTLKWFDDYWFYIEIKFSPKKDFELTNLSISIFQGDEVDNKKIQLFRAEWDTYDNNNIHPQPHWHIYPTQYKPEIHKDFETFIGAQENEGFPEYLGSRKNINIAKFHFAMNGQWSERKGHIHKIYSSEEMIYWLKGLLGYIKEQLKYLN